jgi:hypothetical protein
MWRDNDQPYQGTLPADLRDESSDSAGFSDPLGDAVCAFAWTFIVGLVAFLTWTYKNGGLPLWNS